ncbi:MAG: hypothetical protein ACXW18_08845 [Pyrinomonadaceae bacterium]
MKKSEDESSDEIKQAVDSGVTDKAFWHSRTPEERLWAMELMNRLKYGYDENSMPRIQRVFEVVQMKRYSGQDDPH